MSSADERAVSPDAPAPDTSLSREFLQVEVAGPVATLTLDRPEKRNALTIAMWQSLGQVCRDLAGVAELRAVVVTGAGSSFCAGADITALSVDDAKMKAAVFEAEEALRRVAVPTIAEIRGYCMGGGNQIAVACDVRVAAESAVFAIPPAKLSVVYPANSVRALLALVGPSAAKDLIFTARSLIAAEALRIGLVDDVVPDDELRTAVADRVGAMLALAPLTQVAAKEMINAMSRGDNGDELYHGWYRQWQGSEDGVEGPRAFLDKRRPVFTWRPRPRGSR